MNASYDATCCSATEAFCTLDKTCKDPSTTDDAGCCATGEKLCRTTRTCVASASFTNAVCGCDLATDTYCTADSTCKPSSAQDDTCCMGVAKICKLMNICMITGWDAKTCSCSSPSTETYCTADDTCITTTSGDDTCCLGDTKICKLTNTCVAASAWDATTCSCTSPATETLCSADNTCKITANADDECCLGSRMICRKTNSCVTPNLWAADTCGCTRAGQVECTADNMCKDTAGVDDTCCNGTDMLCRQTDTCITAALRAGADATCGCTSAT